MDALSATEKKTLVETIQCNSGTDLDYFGFVETALAAFEDIPGFETKSPDIDLLNDLWHIYSPTTE
ncbi:hypothetical protein RJO15_21025 [Herbaspirillum huttiense F1]|uniref:hypothetical protein n=1 Tax=Herbaspirillum TaxID=963 RepID=UPI0016024328|nr:MULTISPECIES: hypothetical protein [Herbaspirillum]MDR6742032.1 hypothetical protein [Herbaspirillum sp. 1173]MDT0358284.1 hypothetical protein [Herbaspirillum huttiense F1]QNB05763.1 hypothetical protein G5S34_02525 [Herbaspirillum frisingense]